MDRFAYVLDFGGRGFHTHHHFCQCADAETTCVFCGQCVGVCPTGNLKPKVQ